MGEKEREALSIRIPCARRLSGAHGIYDWVNWAARRIHFECVFDQPELQHWRLVRTL
jgi:hypothetical protein